MTAVRDSNRNIRIVSGGQTGVDRAALDAALELGRPCGGWCPRGRKALNVAGPRENKCPGIHDKAMAFLLDLLAKLPI
jgi:hypothetical protein